MKQRQQPVHKVRNNACFRLPEGKTEVAIQVPEPVSRIRAGMREKYA
jgi:hypothetical protein